VLVVSVGGLLTWRAFATTVIPSGYDQFTTSGSGATNEQWGALPAGFFTNKEGFGSYAISAQTPTFTGRNSVPGFDGDTVIERTSSVNVPGSTALLVAGIRFIGESQLTATFPGGTPSVTYTVLAQESQIAKSTGEMSFNSDGSYSSSLTINREYTFLPTDTTQPKKVADSTTERDSGGNLIFPALDLSGGGTWSQSNSGGPVVQAESTTTGGPGGPGGSATPAPTKNPCLVNPNSEAGLLAKHGILPCGCKPTPSPSPTSSVTPKPTATVVSVGSGG